MPSEDITVRTSVSTARIVEVGERAKISLGEERGSHSASVRAVLNGGLTRLRKREAHHSIFTIEESAPIPAGDDAHREKDHLHDRTRTD